MLVLGLSTRPVRAATFPGLDLEDEGQSIALRITARSASVRTFDEMRPEDLARSFDAGSADLDLRLSNSSSCREVLALVRSVKVRDAGPDASFDARIRLQVVVDGIAAKTIYLDARGSIFDGTTWRPLPRSRDWMSDFWMEIGRVITEKRHASGPPPHADKPESSHRCSPPGIAGIVPGFSERRDVEALHGAAGRQGDTEVPRTLEYLSATGIEQLIVELGEDHVVSAVRLRAATTASRARFDVAAACVSRRLDTAGAAAGDLRLGMTFDEVTAAMGEPKDVSRAGRWTFFDGEPVEDCGGRALIVTFSEGVASELAVVSMP